MDRSRDIHNLIIKTYPDFPADLLCDIINTILMYEIKQPEKAKGDK